MPIVVGKQGGLGYELSYHNFRTNAKNVFEIEFQKAVCETGTEYHARGFSSWNHFTGMLFQDSLRGIEAGLATQAQGLYHLGIKPVHRSTLAYANEHRTHELFKKTSRRNLWDWLNAPFHEKSNKPPFFSDSDLK